MKFTGHERDYAGGMGGEDGHAVDDMHARFYSPTTGRFLSVDPIFGNLLRPRSWNRYTYVFNDPANYNDPTGMAAGPIVCNDTGCSVTVTPDPPPQLPPDYLKRQPSFWEEQQLPDGMQIDKLATYQQSLRRRAAAGDEGAMMELGQQIPGLSEDDSFYMLLAGGITSAIRLGSTEATVVLPRISFSKHAINQAISRDGVGVSSRAILDALKNPVTIKAMGSGATKIVGREATLVLNELFRVITLWANSSSAWRILP